MIEEVARIYGIDKMVGTVPVLPTKRGTYNKFIRGVRDILSSLGLNETLSYTLIPQNISHMYTLDEFEEINLLDPMSDDHKTLRYSLLPSMMLTYDYNAKRNNKDLGLFEIGKKFKKVNGEYFESKSLAILMSGTIACGIKREKVSFYDIKAIMEELLDSLGFKNRYSLVVKDLPKEFHPGASATINLNGKNIGVIGKIHPNVSRDNIYLMEIDLDVLENLGVKKIEYQEISKYPSITKDVAFVLSKDITNEEIMSDMKKSAGRYLTSILLFDIYEIDNKTHSLAYKMVFSSKDETLTDDVVMPIFDKVIDDIKNKYHATLRDK